MRKKTKKRSKKERKFLPKGTVERLSVYLNCLIEFKEDGYEYITSHELAECVGINSAEIRRDFLMLKTRGRKGVGYSLDSLISELQKILGSKKEHGVVLVGAGNLGSALAAYEGLTRHGFVIKGVFDADPEKIGQLVAGHKIRDVKNLGRFIRDNNIEIGVIAVPEGAAQAVADEMVRNGIKVIVNYAAVRIIVPSDVKVHHTNPAVELLHTLYFLSRK